MKMITNPQICVPADRDGRKFCTRPSRLPSDNERLDSAFRDQRPETHIHLKPCMVSGWSPSLDVFFDVTGYSQVR